jgi:hypothetical protein
VWQVRDEWDLRKALSWLSDLPDGCIPKWTYTEPAAQQIEAPKYVDRWGYIRQSPQLPQEQAELPIAA